MSGGVRVCARFRPQNKLELKQQAVEVVRVDGDEATARLGVVSAARGSFEPTHTFTFDKVFGTQSTQAQVYEATAKPLVAAALRGYNCTCFVYGQTGTGKTFSMEGVPGDKEYAGIIPRVMDDIFDGIHHMQAELEFLVKVSYVEIYLEKIRDLLAPAANNLSVRESRDRGVWVAGTTEVCCASSDEMLAVMRLGGANRVIASTRMNNDSSRSHSVFIITIEQRNVGTGSTKSGKLFLVDLAGSEKVGKTQAKGQTLKEAQHINKSLSALGSVMNALTSGQPNAHIPYRDSKLTRLLQDALGGNSETTLLVCGSVSSYNAEETLTTLRFGQRAKSIKNKPKVNEECTVAEYKQLVLEKDKLIAALQAQLDQLQAGGFRSDRTATNGAPDKPSDDTAAALRVQELVTKIEQLEDEQVSKASEVTSLEERVVELEAQRSEWQACELASTKRDQQTEELRTQLAFAERHLSAKVDECEQLQSLLRSQDPITMASVSQDQSASASSMEMELLRQQLSAKTTEAAIASSHAGARADELVNCRGFYERQLAVLEDKLHDLEAHVLGFMDGDDKRAQLESVLQKGRALRSVRGGNRSSSSFSSFKRTSANGPQRPRASTSSSTADGWTVDDEVFPTAPIDMDSPVVQRLLASVPATGREKMYKWLVFVLEGRDIRGTQFHPELAIEGVNDALSVDIRRLIVPLLRRRQDIHVTSLVRTRFVKVADLRIVLAPRQGDTMHLDHRHDVIRVTDGGEGSEEGVEGGEEQAASSTSKPSTVHWAQGHVFYGPKGDNMDETVLHTPRVRSSNPRVDRFVSEPVDLSATLRESMTILVNSGSSSSSSSSSSSASSSSSSSNGGGFGMLRRLTSHAKHVAARYQSKRHVHEDSLCAGCGASPIVGAKWTCHVCAQLDLCDACYALGVHGCEISLAMCRRVEALAVARHRKLGDAPELFALLRAHVCGDDVVYFREIVAWLEEIVGGRAAAQLRQRSLVKSGLHPEIRARLVAQLGAIASERTDLELQTEWVTEREEEEGEEGEDGEEEEEERTSAPALLETLRMYVVEVGKPGEMTAPPPPCSSPSLSQRTLSVGDRGSSDSASSLASTKSKPLRRRSVQ